MTTVVGGVGQLFQGDLDLGRIAVERLQTADLGHDVVVEDFHYGAVAVVQRLQDLDTGTLVIIGAEARGRPPGTVERRRVAADVDPGVAQQSVADAVVGYVTIDLLTDVVSALGGPPRRIVAIEVEPGVAPDGTPGAVEGLSPLATAALGEALDLVRAADGHLEPSPMTEAMQDLLDELDVLDREGRWGRTFSARDALRQRIADTPQPPGMDHLDWGLWWSVIEELDRLGAVEAVT
jgi:hypothetical protein